MALEVDTQYLHLVQDIAVQNSAGNYSQKDKTGDEMLKDLPCTVDIVQDDKRFEQEVECTKGVEHI